MNICLNLKKEEPKKITTTKELAQYILESGDFFSDAEDDEGEGFDLKNWSPLREVYDSMPTFSVGA